MTTYMYIYIYIYMPSALGPSLESISLGLVAFWFFRGLQQGVWLEGILLVVVSHPVP